jgi:hypothetical protein
MRFGSLGWGGNGTGSLAASDNLLMDDGVSLRAEMVCSIAATARVTLTMGAGVGRGMFGKVLRSLSSFRTNRSCSRMLF